MSDEVIASLPEASCRITSPSARNDNGAGVFFFVALSFLFYCNAFAQSDDKTKLELSREIIEARAKDDFYAPFEELKRLYFQENQYNEFIDFLQSIKEKRQTAAPFADYYTALSRYHQLEYLEDKQLWDEYFNQGTKYREELLQCARRALGYTTSEEPLYAQLYLLLWQFHALRQDSFAESSLQDLESALLKYSGSQGPPFIIKEAADRFLKFGKRKQAKKFYDIYADRILSADIENDALREIALSFYNEGNLELSQGLYTAYLERISSAGKPAADMVTSMIDVAKLFSYSDQGLNDMLYAEEIFARAETLTGGETFGPELIYLRAFNLEKAREYSRAKDLYLDLLKADPQTPYADEANFKVAMIYAYVLRDLKSAVSFFEKIASGEGEFLSPQAISSFYQLGLLSQWQGRPLQAKQYYDRLIEKSGDGFKETAALARRRLKEIKEERPIEYNLKMFLDASFKKEYSTSDLEGPGLKISLYRLSRGQEGSIGSCSYMPAAGCMQVDLNYLWSGHCGAAKLSKETSSFNTSYNSSGTKEINLVVLSPAGIVERNFELLDVY